MLTIDSAKNQKYRRWLSLLDGAGIRTEGLALLSGSKVIAELLARDPGRVREILLPPKAEPITADVPHARLGGDLFRALDVVGTKRPLAVIEAPNPPAFVPGPPRGLEVLLALSDPSNLGACLRTAEAVGVTRVILTAECASPFLPRALRASVGSSLRLNLERTGPLAEQDLSGAIGLDAAGVPLNEFAWPDHARVVLGEEGRGLPPGRAGTLLAIPMRQPVDSLNATVAASIALYAYVFAKR